MCPTHIKLISTEIQPFGATRAAYGQKCLIYGILGHFYHKYGHKGQILRSSNWILTLPDPTDEIQQLVPLRKTFFRPLPTKAHCAQWLSFSVTIWALVGGVGRTQDLIHPIHNVSLGNWGGLGEYGKQQIRYKQQESQKPDFALSGKNSVTWVALLGGIADPPDQNHIV